MARSARLQVGLTNMGGGRLEVTANSEALWISVIPGPYYLGPGQSQTLSVQVNTTVLVTSGQHIGQVTLHTNEGDLSLPVSVAVEPPFILNPADPQSGVTSTREMARYCDANWNASLNLLADGRLEACLHFLGESGLVLAAQQARHNPDPNLGLEGFLQLIRPHKIRRLPIMNLRAIEARLGFGLGGIGVTVPPRSVSLRIRNPHSNGYLWGEVSPLVPWLEIHPKTFHCAPGKEARLSLRVDAARWSRASRLFSAGIALFEVVLYDHEGKVTRRLQKYTSPGWLFLAVLGFLTLVTLTLALFAAGLYMGWIG